MPSWDCFNAKYPTEELQRARFEDLARSLFCRRYNILYGISQCINHAGNETETIIVDGEEIGFQAKYFRKEIDENQIIHSIKKARERHSGQTKVIIYTNLDFGNPPNTQDVTKKRKKIEDVANNLHLDLEWQTNNMILDQVAPTDWIYDVFFGTEPNLLSLYNEERDNTRYLLNPINSQIVCNGFFIKVDRKEFVNKIKKAITNHENIILHGEGGCGKTAIIKDLVDGNNGDFEICIRKAQSLNVEKLDDVFKFKDNYSFTQFITLFQNDNKKVFVIDSAERIQEIEDTTPLTNMLRLLNDNGWSIVFTVRNNFLKDLCDDLRNTYSLDYTSLSLDYISEEELINYAQKFSIELPSNNDFRLRLCNLFYLNLYAKYYERIKRHDSYQAFIELVWKEKIAGRNKKNGLSIKREMCFDRCIKERSNSNHFYLDCEKYDPEALQSLINDEVLEMTEVGFFITHDIYEEWGVLRLIEKEWNRKNNVLEFFYNIGMSYLMRSSFRQWLTEKIEHQIETVRELIYQALNKEINAIWRDEIIVSVLLSSYCTSFLQSIEDILIKDGSPLLKRIMYLLQVACKQFCKTVNINEYNYPIYKPYGNGWDSLIEWIYLHKDKNFKIPYQIKVLSDWCTYNHDGKTTRYAGLIALDFFAKTENNVRFYDQSLENTLCQIICNASSELKKEITSVIAKICANKWIHHNSPYQTLSLFILARPKNSQILIRNLPFVVMKLAETFWIIDKENEIVGNHYGNPLNIEHHYGFREIDFRHNYSPASAEQSPMYQLLLVVPHEAICFLVKLVNYSIDYCKKQNDIFKSLDTKELIVYNNNGSITQTGNYVLWGVYRGAVHVTVSNLLQSLHMALEKYLLELAKYDYKYVTDILDFILSNSRSVSLTAVVSSIVMAYPERYWRHALLLFKTIDFFHYDSIRWLDENHQTWFINMAALQDGDAAAERQESAKLDFRKNNLESLCVKYQYIRTKNLSEDNSIFIINEIHKIIDSYFKEIDSKHDNKDKTIQLLYRIDKRTHKLQISKGDDYTYIELCPQLPDILQKHSEKFVSESQNMMRYSFLHTWAHQRLRHEKSSVYTDYEDKPHAVCDTIKSLRDVIAKGEPLLPLDESSQYSAAAILIRDYYDQLNTDEIQFCIQLVEECLNYLSSDLYQPQISDGTECCIHAIPQILVHNIHEKNKYIKYLVRTLLNRTPIGEYKRICDYAIESIHEAKLWESYESFMFSLLDEYIIAACHIDQYIKDEIEKRDKGYNALGASLYSREKVWKRVCDAISHRIDAKISSIIELERVEILLELIPFDTRNSILVDYVKQIIPFIVLSFTKGIENKYYRSVYLFKAYAYYVLNRSLEDIDLYIKPLLNVIKGGNHESEYFLLEFIYTEDRIHKKEAFWYVWKLLYDTMVKRGGWYDGRLLSIYMLSDNMALSEGEWHSFGEKNIWLFENLARDCGSSPVVLYAVAKSLNSLACKFTKQGINWLYAIIHENSTMNLGEYQSNSIFYLEKLLDRYLRKNRMEIRKDNMYKNKLLEILSFMVDRDSVQAYMLRDYIA